MTILFETQIRKELSMGEEKICILKVETCPSLSGRSDLTYHIGSNSKGAIYLRLFENTGQGNFSKDWIPLDQLDTVMTSGEETISAGLFRSMFQGKSVNTASFIIAVMKAERLLKVSEKSQHGYERIDPTEFKKGIQALMGSAREIPPLKAVKVKEAAVKSQTSEIHN